MNTEDLQYRLGICLEATKASINDTRIWAIRNTRIREAQAIRRQIGEIA